MSASPFWQSTAGHVAKGTAGLLVAVIGLVAVLGPGDYFDAVVSLSLMTGFLGFVWTGGLATQGPWAPVAVLILTMPLVLGLYFVGLYLAVHAGAFFGMLASIAGLGLLGTSLPSAPRRTRSLVDSPSGDSKGVPSASP